MSVLDVSPIGLGDSSWENGSDHEPQTEVPSLVTLIPPTPPHPTPTELPANTFHVPPQVPKAISKQQSRGKKEGDTGERQA